MGIFFVFDWGRKYFPITTIKYMPLYRLSDPYPSKRRYQRRSQRRSGRRSRRRSKRSLRYNKQHRYRSSTAIEVEEEWVRFMSTLWSENKYEKLPGDRLDDEMFHRRVCYYLISEPLGPPVMYFNKAKSFEFDDERQRIWDQSEFMYAPESYDPESGNLPDLDPYTAVEFATLYNVVNYTEETARCWMNLTWYEINRYQNSILSMMQQQDSSLGRVCAKVIDMKRTNDIEMKSKEQNETSPEPPDTRTTQHGSNMY